MKKLYVAVVLFFIAQFPLSAQCLQIESILVDACVPGSGCTNSVSPTCNCEGKNEMVVFRVGATPLAVSSVVATWPNNSFLGWNTPDATTASNLSTLNSTIVKCGYLKEPTGGTLPANSEVMIITSTDMCLTANSFANLQDTLIVIFQNAGNFQGHFANTDNSGTITSVPTGTTSLRSLSLSYAPLTCTQTVTYDRKLLVNQMGSYGGSAAQNDGSTVQFDALGNATYVNYGCQAPYIPIQVKPSASTNVCFNGTLSLTGVVSGPYTTFSWSGGTGTFANANSLNTTYTPGSGDVGTVTIYLTAQGKCAANVVKDSIVVSITPAPSPTITATPTTTVCPGTSVTLSVNPETSTSYSWSPGGMTGTGITVTPLSQSFYSVVATNSCASTADSYTVNVYPAPNITASSGTICAGDTINLTANGGVSYSWSPGSGLSSTAGSSVNAFPSGTTTYSVFGTDANGCNDTAMVIVSVNQLPPLTVNSPSVCSGSVATLTVTGANSYTWSTSQTGTVITVSPGSNASYTVSGTDANGCTNEVVSSVSVWSLPNVTATNTMVCKGQSVVVTASGAVNYVWSNSQNGSSITVSPLTTMNYSVLGTDANGCQNYAVATVTVNLPPNISSSNASFCASGTATLTANGAVTYTWSTSQTGPSIVVSPTSSTNYTVTGTDANGCTNTSVSNVTVNNLPTINVNSPGVCAGNSVTLTASGATTYTWSTSQNGTSISVNPSSATSYTVTGTDANGCMNSAVSTVTINPLPVVTASSATACAGTNTSVTAGGALTYTWNTGQTGATISVPGAAAAYTVTGTDANGCVGSAVCSVSVTASPSPQSINGSAVICPGQNTTLTVPSGPYSYSWTGPNGSLGSADSAIANSAGVYTVIVSNACGNASAQFTVSVSAPQAGFAPNLITAQAPATFTFTNSSSGTQLSSYWTFGNGSNSTQWSPANTYTADGAYDVVLVVTDQYGCMDTTDFIVYVTDTLPPVVIPNIFSPNGDLVNDIFTIKGHGLSYFECHILDRWGLEMYQWQDINGGWDGKNHSNGQLVSDGTYYYLVSYIDKKGKYNSVGGYLQLVR